MIDTEPFIAACGRMENCNWCDKHTTSETQCALHFERYPVDYDSVRDGAGLQEFLADASVPNITTRPERYGTHAPRS